MKIFIHNIESIGRKLKENIIFFWLSINQMKTREECGAAYFNNMRRFVLKIFFL